MSGTERSHTHPTFARGYSALARLAERDTLGRWRSEVLAGARGRLLVVGLGPGVDLRHLPPGVSEVIAVEPDPGMRRQSRREVASVSVPVRVVGGVAEELPLRTRSVDAVLCALVLCSVDDQRAALDEVRRVLRPGGRLLLLEHVRAPTDLGSRRCRTAWTGSGRGSPAAAT